MKWYQGLALVVSVALAGCAAPGGGADGASDGASAATSTARTAPRMPRSGEMPDVAVSELRGGQVAALEAPADLWERVRRGFAGEIGPCQSRQNRARGACGGAV